MYGLVNKALEQMIIESYGDKSWKAIKDKADDDINVFISNISYPDDITYKLVGAASAELNIEAGILLYDFGKYWVLKTGAQSYRSLFEAAGSTLKEFLLKLQDFHARVMLYYPNLTPPTFFIENIQDKSLDVHYMSHRKGLTEFVRGLLDGLAEYYETNIHVEAFSGPDGPMSHDIFHIKFIDG